MPESTDLNRAPTVLYALSILLNEDPAWHAVAGLQRSGGAALSSNEEPAALQNLWEQTRATGGQQKGAIALGAANILGIGILANWEGGLAALAGTNLGFMLNLLPLLGVGLAPCLMSKEAAMP